MKILCLQYFPLAFWFICFEVGFWVFKNYLPWKPAGGKKPHDCHVEWQEKCHYQESQDEIEGGSHDDALFLCCPIYIPAAWVQTEKGQGWKAWEEQNAKSSAGATSDDTLLRQEPQAVKSKPSKAGERHSVTAEVWLK